MRLAIAFAVLAASAFGQECPDPSKCAVNVRADQLKWQKVFPDLGPGGPEIATLRADPTTGATQLMLRAIDAFYVPWHWHTGNEMHAILAGTFTAECEGKIAELPEGSFNWIPARVLHRAWLSEGCMLFISVDAAWDLNWVEGPPAGQSGPKPGDATTFDAKQLRFDGVVVDAIEIEDAPGRAETARSRRIEDAAEIRRVLAALEPSSVPPSGGENRWIVRVHAGKGGLLHVVWVFDYGEWGYGGRTRGTSRELSELLPALLEQEN